MRSPMRELLEPLGARYAGPDSAIADEFGDPAREHAAARESAAIFDRSDRTKIQITGRDRVRFLHNLCTNDIVGLGSGRGCEAYLTSVQGKILAYVRVFATNDSLWIDSIPDSSDSICGHLERYLISERVELADRTPEYVQLMVIGPASRAVVESAAQQPLPELDDLAHATLPLAAAACHVRFTDSLGVPACELVLPAAEATALWPRVWQAASEHGARLMGLTAYESIRVEAGLPEYGADVDDSNFPQEVGRDKRAISFRKGCYLGQETVARIDALGHVNRHLVGLLLPDCAAAVDRGAIVRAAGRDAGSVTSSVYSFSAGHAIALAYVRRGLDKPDTELTVESANGPVRAVVRTPPCR